jgi:hypothetical protein
MIAGVEEAATTLLRLIADDAPTAELAEAADRVAAEGLAARDLGAIVRTADQSGRPFSRRLTARSASRLASRSASACRLSQVFLPRARAISTFARPSLK